jgi:TRAP-type C4-dicarboxylate transport system substrate-binding protein
MTRSWTMAIAALALVSLCTMQAAGATKVQLRAVLPLPPQSWLYQGLQRFKKNVENNSKGEIEVTIIPSSPLYEGKEIRSAAASRTIEIGALLLSDYSADIPAANFFAQPFMFFSEPLMKAAVASQGPVRAPLDLAILQSNGVRVLWWQAAGATVLISKGESVLTPADIAGKKVRVPLPALAQMVQLCGATPVVEAASGPESDTVKSAKTDMIMVPIANVLDGKLWTVMRALTVTHHIAQEFVIVMNEGVSNSLTSDQKRAVQEAAAETERYMYEDIRQDESENMEIAAKNGMKVAEVTAEQAALWKACATPMLESFLQQSGDLGQKLMDGYRRILADIYRQQRK